MLNSSHIKKLMRKLVRMGTCESEMYFNLRNAGLNSISSNLSGSNVHKLNLRNRLLPALALLLTLNNGFLPNAYADDHVLTREEAVEIAKQRSNNGRVLGVDKIKDENGATIYAVKIISNGRVKVYQVSEKP